MISTADFSPVIAQSREEIADKIFRSGVQSCEFSFANLVMWGKTFDIRYALYNNHLYLKELDDDEKEQCLLFLPDAADEPDAAELRQVSDALRDENNPGIFYCVPPEYLDRHRDLDRFFTISPMGEDYDDYLYDIDALVELRGEKLAKKRNLIRQFLRNYPDAEVREINASMIGECLALAELWRSTHPDKDSLEMLQEKAALGSLTNNFSALSMVGAAVYIKNEMIAFELCSPISSEIYDEHYEKSLYTYKGAAQFLNCETAKLLRGKAKLLNREQDMGLPGLRQAKRSYAPCEMVKNFALVPKKVFFMTNDKQNSAPGIFWAAVSVFCWGTLFPAVSFLLKRGNVDCYTMAQSRFLAAGVVMLAMIAVQERRAPWENLTKIDFFHLAMQSIFAAAMSGLLFFGQSFGIPVVNASMLEAEAPILIFLLSIVILKEKVNFLQTLGLLLGFAGSMLVLKAVGRTGIAITSISFGDAMVFAGAVSWALYTVLAHRTIQKLGGLRYTAWSLLFAGIWILLFQLAAKLPCRYPVLLPDLAATLYLGLIPTALAFFAWNNAQRYISPGFLGISGYFTPMLTALLGWLCFSETVTFFQVAGMILVVGAALIEPEISELLRRKLRGKGTANTRQ